GHRIVEELAVVVVCQAVERLARLDPLGLVDLIAVDPERPAGRFHEEIVDYLWPYNAFLSLIGISNAGEPVDDAGIDASLFADFAKGGLLDRFTRIGFALWK